MPYRSRSAGHDFTAFAAPLIAGILTRLPVLKRARMPKQNLKAAAEYYYLPRLAL